MRRVLLCPRSPLFTVLLQTCAWLLVAAGGTSEMTTNYTLPLVIAPNGGWDGIDGNWSAFNVGLGSPAQNVSLFVSTASSQTWAIIPQGCSQSGSYAECSTARGGIFNYSASSSWRSAGTFTLALESNLGLSSNALFGSDSISLAALNGPSPNISNATIGGTAGSPYFNGLLGINPTPTQFGSGSPSLSLLAWLKKKNYIQSLSWGYNAGASYRSPAVPASLTLGGYNSKRSGAGQVVYFNFSSSASRDIVVGLQSIVTPSQIQSSISGTELLPGAIYAPIDSTVAEIWLPIEACKAFEVEFGLQYNETYGMYLVNNTLRSTLLERNPNITFTMGQTTTGGTTVSVTLPFSAFDLTARVPYNNLPSDQFYFPLQRAQNSSQYTIGRTFLQEAYLVADYENSMFGLSQNDWSDPDAYSLISFPAANTADNNNNTTTSGLSSGAIAGIAVGVALGAILLAALLAWYLIRRRRAARFGSHEKLAVGSPTLSGVRGTHDTVFPKAELEGSSADDTADKKLLLPPAPGTPGGSSTHGTDHLSPAEGGTLSSTRSGPFSIAPSEADSRERAIYEMPGDLPPVREADGRQLSEKEAVDRRNLLYNGVGAAATTPDEPLPTFTETAATPVSAARESPPPPPPSRPMVTAADVVPARLPRLAAPPQQRPGGPHRAFSFEASAAEQDLER